MNSTLFSYRCFCVLRSHFFSYLHFPSFLHKLSVTSCSERASVSTVLMRNRGARTQPVLGTFDWLAMELHIHSVGLGWEMCCFCLLRSSSGPHTAAKHFKHFYAYFSHVYTLEKRINYRSFGKNVSYVHFGASPRYIWHG